MPESKTRVTSISRKNRRHGRFYTRMVDEIGYPMNRKPGPRYDYQISTGISGVDARFSSQPPKKDGETGRIYCAIYFSGSASDQAKNAYHYIYDAYMDEVECKLAGFNIEWRHNARDDRQIRISTPADSFDDEQFAFCSNWMVNTALPLMMDTLFPLVKEYLSAVKYLGGVGI
jgi:hypothetical protein